MSGSLIVCVSSGETPRGRVNRAVDFQSRAQCGVIQLFLITRLPAVACAKAVTLIPRLRAQCGHVCRFQLLSFSASQLFALRELQRIKRWLVDRLGHGQAVVGLVISQCLPR